tara:strand:- start:20623 stop:21204 length:582 start_codon:yes stop_codon:yes gene_type:complete
MHGIINRGLQNFVLNIYGNDVWEDVCADAGVTYNNFETMLTYDDIITEQVLDAIGGAVNRTRSDILEDFGTFIVSEHCSASVRKLLRLGGETFVEFLHSLEDVYDRVQIAIPDLETPTMRLKVKSKQEYVLRYEFYKCGYGAVFLGLLRAMADDYGSLVTINHESRNFADVDKDIFYIHVFEDRWTDDTVRVA